MSDTRRKNVNWRLNVNPDNTVPSNDAHLAVLMDIRDELQGIRARLDCHETLAIPRTLRSIRAAMYPSRRRKARAT